MRTLGTFVIAAAVVAGLATAGHAQTPTNPLLPTAGTREIGIAGSWEFTPNKEFDLSDLTYGPFLSKNLQVGVKLSYDYANPEGGGSSTELFLGPFANYYFPGSSATEPYVGVSLGFANDKPAGGPTTNTFAYGAQVGVKHFLNSNVAVFAELPWLHYDKHIEDTGKSDSVNLNFGLAYYLR
jgi:hypothetical protein